MPSDCSTGMAALSLLLALKRAMLMKGVRVALCQTMKNVNISRPFFKPMLDQLSWRGEEGRVLDLMT